MRTTTRLMLMGNQYKRDHEGADRHRQPGGYGRNVPEYTPPRNMEPEALRYGHEPGYGDDGGKYWPRKNGHSKDPLQGKREEHQQRFGMDEEYERQQRRNKLMRHEEDDEEEEPYAGKKKVDEKCARKWVEKMKNVDGSIGAHFQPERAEQLRKRMCPECEQWEWYVAVNMMFSDYAETAQQMGVDADEYYAHMAKAFLQDEDAGEGKLAKYMENIPKK